MAMTLTAPEPMPRRPDKRACAEHEAEAGRDVADAVLLKLAIDGIGAAEAQAVGKRVGGDGLFVSFISYERLDCSLNENQAKDDGKSVRADAAGKKCAENCAQGRSDLKKHADANVGVALADVGCGRAG